MNRVIIIWIGTVALFNLLSVQNTYAQNELETLFLSWNSDPTSTMVINWHSKKKMDQDSLYFRPIGTNQWLSKGSLQSDFPFSDHVIYKSNLLNLQSNTRYEFRIGSSEEVYWFKTMPVDIQEKPVVFAVGGDTYDRDLNAPRHLWMERMNRTVINYNPDFIVWGGDLAYADGREDQVWRWYGWLKAVKNSLIREDGKVIPIVVAIGNHEVNTNYYEWGMDYEETDELRKVSAPYFYSLFDFPGQPGYNVLDFSDYLSLIILDTDHTNPISGTQTKWLENTLSERKGVKHVFPVYHVPAYPSTKSDLNSRSSKRVREYWTPLFDEYNLSYAFEHHDHAYKRTPPIRDEKIDSKGVIYLGDGGWATKVREVKDSDTTWYLDKTVRVRYALMVSVYRDQTHLLAIDEYGRTIEEFPKIFDRPKYRVETNNVLMSDGGLSISGEFAHRTGQIYFDSYYKGYTGDGYAWIHTDDNLGMLKWFVPIEQHGIYRIRLRYSNSSVRKMGLWQINDGEHQQNTTFNMTDSESDWEKTDSIEVELRAGMNELKLILPEETELYIDRIEVSH